MEQINLNIIPDGVMPVCHASQFDKNRTIRFNLKDNGSVYTLAGTETITCTVRKPDDTENTINVANTSSSYVDVTFGLGDTDLSGYTMCELKIVKGTQTIGSRNFLLNIEADAFDGSKFEERSASGAIASFETNYIDNLNELIVNITATQAGSGTPDNPNPINGYTEANITRCGKNLVFKTIPGSYINPDGVISIDNTYDLQCAVVKQGVTYTMSGSISFIGGFFTSEPEIGSTSYDGTRIVGGPVTFIAPISGYVVFRTSAGYLTPQLELGSTPSAYSAYTGNTYTIAFGQTVYGGVLDVTRGKLTVTHGIVDLGSLNWTYESGDKPYFRFTSAYSDMKKPLSTDVPNAELEGYTLKSFNDWYLNRDDNMTYCIGTDGRVYLINTSYTDAATFKTAMSGKYLVYELATPTTVQLTPTEVRTLLNCNIFADTGDVVSCKYLVEVT